MLLAKEKDATDTEVNNNKEFDDAPIIRKDDNPAPGEAFEDFQVDEIDGAHETVKTKEKTENETG